MSNSPLGLSNFNIGSYYNNTTNDGYVDNNTLSSIFNDGKFYYRPTTKYRNGEAYYDNGASRIHTTTTGNTQDLYDTSINSILDHFSNANGNQPALQLKASDFAYLSDLGRYSNNRLIIARRFAQPVRDDLYSVDMVPLATLISWVPPEEDNFFDLEFGEKWQETKETDFRSLLNDIKRDSGLANLAGDSMISKPVPIPGFTTGLQFEILNKLGLTDADINNIPFGNPNLIKTSMQRQVLGPGQGGSGLDAKIVIEMSCKWEQKFIPNNDPTLVFMDILGTVLRFGTSEASFFLTGKGGQALRDGIKDFQTGNFKKIITDLLNIIVESIKTVGNAIVDAVSGAIDTVENGGSVGDAIGSLLADTASLVTAPVISKYKIKIEGIITALTGQESTPWHVTLGNPKAPVFTSGDMVCDMVELKFGNTLAFNDLPSTIEAKFKLKNARPLGLSEIFGKFNNGQGRTYIGLKTRNEDVRADENGELAEEGETN